MKLEKRSISAKDGAGKIKLLPVEDEDMWHVYNLLNIGDRIRTKTVRKIKTESDTGSSRVEKRTIDLTIAIQKFHYDPSSAVIRISGSKIEGDSQVRKGAAHTIQLELKQHFELEKDCWDTIALDRLDMACSISKRADLAVLILGPNTAHLALVGGHMTVWKMKVETSIPKKRQYGKAHSKALEKHFKSIMIGMCAHIDFSRIKHVLLASPGFVNDDFSKYMFKVSESNEDFKAFRENKSKIVTVHCTCSHKRALQEVLEDPKVQLQLVESDAAQQAKILADFFEFLHTDPMRVCYGFKLVEIGVGRCIVKDMLISDTLFRSVELETRKKFSGLVDLARSVGTSVHIFSSMHTSGEQLAEIGGFAAVLKFPCDLEAEAEAMGINLFAGEKDGETSDDPTSEEEEEFATADGATG